jgi:hypothetical protein
MNVNTLYGPEKGAFKLGTESAIGISVCGESEERIFLDLL